MKSHTKFFLTAACALFVAATGCKKQSGSDSASGAKSGATSIQVKGSDTMVNVAQARAFADHYIKVHLAEVADGQTYSQVSAKAQANRDDQQLAGQVQTLFRGETLRGLLLNAYAWDTMATVAFIAAWISLAAGVLLLLLAALGLRHARTAAKTPTTNPPAEYATT